ncbi:hypothetical protein V2J09_003879 [Rumex salicifolius]
MDDGSGASVSLIRMVMESDNTASTSSIFTNFPLISAIIAFVLAQSIKVFTTWCRDRRWDLKQLVASGGMPSSHSATVNALATAVGLQDGIGSSLFATTAILACIVMYDAFGIRLQAGRQAEVLNQIVYELPAEHPLAESRPLHEILGHTPPQVIAGALLGILTSTIVRLIVLIAKYGISNVRLRSLDGNTVWDPTACDSRLRRGHE